MNRKIEEIIREYKGKIVFEQEKTLSKNKKSVDYTLYNCTFFCYNLLGDESEENNIIFDKTFGTIQGVC